VKGEAMAEVREEEREEGEEERRKGRL